MRRNPVIADLFHRMKYMERRGSGLRKIVSETEKLPGYTEAYKPEFSSTATDFRVILKNVNYNLEGDAHQVIHQVIELSTVSKQILAFCTTPKSKKELAVFCGFKDLRNFTLKHINPLLESGQLEMTIPDKPKSRKSKIYYSSFRINREAGHWVSSPIVLLLFIPNYIHIIYPYAQSWIANFKLCTLPNSQITASGNPIGLIKNAITSYI